MSKIAVINITSFGREFPEHITELEEKVGLVSKIFLPADTPQSTLTKKLAGYEYVILGNYPTFSEEFFEKNKSIKLIARHGIGYNNVDIKAANEYGVYVTNMPNDIEVDAVAEQAITLLLSVAKHVSTASTMVINGEWNIRRERIVGQQIYGAKTGVIGLGHIGKRFSEIMHHGFGNEILVYDPYVDQSIITSLGYKKCDLITLLKESNFVSLHANLTDETYHILNDETFGYMNQNTILINTSRGDLIDELALLKSLENNKIFGFGADVMSLEPASKEHPLTEFANVLITPHSSIYNLTCMKAMNRKVMNDIYLVENGEKPLEIIELEEKENEKIRSY